MPTSEAVRRADIVYATDERYVVPLTVSIRSLQHHTADPGVVTLVLCDGVSARSKARILASLARPEEVRLVDIDGDDLPDRVVRGVSTVINRTALARLQIPADLVNQLRFVYLDADTVVRTDIRRLLETDLNHHLLGAVYDHYYTLFEARTRRLARAGTKPGRRFNSGVMLINSDQWFQRRCGERAMAIAVAEEVMDQGALNVVCADSWLELDPGWNVTTQQLGRRREFGTNPEQVLIRHLTAIKPWQDRHTTVDDAKWLLEDFHRHLAQTVWPTSTADPPARF
ncbi:glycosyltransferase family 8 protein [Micromonospora sp. NPDC050397]|uniref:glycosyltransferase family 8 protein n=1 Tax=Micromonospora sp. NPDC050397 TaxID=3364279 RepID=UPI00384DBF95